MNKLLKNWKFSYTSIFEISAISVLLLTGHAKFCFAQNQNASALFASAKLDLTNQRYSSALDKFLRVAELEPGYPKISHFIRSSALGIEGEMLRQDRARALESARDVLRRRDKVLADLKTYASVKQSRDLSEEVITVRDDVLFVPGSAKMKDGANKILYLVAKYAELLGNMDIQIRIDPYRKLKGKDNQSFAKKTSLFKEFRKLNYPNDNLTLRADDNSNKAPDRKPDDFVYFNLRSYDKKLEEEVDAYKDLSKTVVANTSDVQLKITAGKTVFTPAEGETVDLGIDIASPMELKRWVFAIVDISYDGIPVSGLDQIRRDKIISQFRGNEVVSEKILWDGTGDDGRGIVAPGKYQLFLEVKDNVLGATYHADDVIIEVLPPKLRPSEIPKAVTVAAPLVSPQKRAGISRKGIEEFIEAPEPPRVRNLKWSLPIKFSENESAAREVELLKLKQVARTLDIYPNQKLLIESYALATESDAVALAKRRLDAIVRLLSDTHEIKASQIKNTSYKIIRPGDDNHIPRVEILVVND